MGEYAGRSQPRLAHSYCRRAEISNSGTFGFTAFMAAECAAADASTALRSRAISPASLAVRSELKMGLTSCRNRKAFVHRRKARGSALADASPSEATSVKTTGRAPPKILD